MKFSPHFSDHEFMCPCGCGQAKMDPRLIDAAESLRSLVSERMGKDTPLYVTRRSGTGIYVGGFRCPKGNSEVGGAPQSQHLYGRGMDVYVIGLSGDDLYKIASTVAAFHGFGVARNWIHLDVRPQAGPVRWRYDDSGKIVPWKEDVYEK